MKAETIVEYKLDSLKEHRQELLDLLYVLEGRFVIVRSHTDNPYEYAYCCGQQSVIEEIRSLIK